MSLLTEGQIEGMRATYARTFDQICTIQEPQTATDRYGNTATAAYAEVAWYVACSVVRTSQTEAVDGRDTQITDWAIRVPAATRVTGRSRLVVRDVTYEAVGEPIEFPSHIHVNVRLVDG